MKTILLSLFITVCVGNCFAYYSSEQGRWLNRDPIGVDGGVNLYGFCGNNGIDYWDNLGLAFAYPGNVTQTHSIQYAEGLYEDFQTKYSYGADAGGRTEVKDATVTCSLIDPCNSEGKFTIEQCSITWIAYISLNQNYNGKWGGNARTIVGHEQKHYESYIRRIQKIVEKMKKARNGPNTTDLKSAKDSLADFVNAWQIKLDAAIAPRDFGGHEDHMVEGEERSVPIPSDPGLPFPEDLGEFPLIDKFPDPPSWP